MNNIIKGIVPVSPWKNAQMGMDLLKILSSPILPLQPV